MSIPDTPKTDKRPDDAENDAVQRRMVEYRRHEQTVQQAVYYARAQNAPRFVVRAGQSDFVIESEVQQNQDITDIVWPDGRIYSVVELVQRSWQRAGR